MTNYRPIILDTAGQPKELPATDGLISSAIVGGTGSGGDLLLKSTSHGTKGRVLAEKEFRVHASGDPNSDGNFWATDGNAGGYGAGGVSLWSIMSGLLYTYSGAQFGADPDTIGSGFTITGWTGLPSPPSQQTNRAKAWVADIAGTAHWHFQGESGGAVTIGAGTVSAPLGDFENIYTKTEVESLITLHSGTGPLANIPKSGLVTGLVYRPTDGRLSKIWNGSKYQHISPQHLPWEDGQLHLSAPNYEWEPTTGSEFKCVAAGGGPAGLSEPGSVFIGSSGLTGVINEAVKGTVGSLSAGQWGWDGSTVHVRLSDGTNPNTKPYGHVVADPLRWIGSAGLATAHLVGGVPLMTMTNTSGTPTIRMRGRPVPSGSWVYYSSWLPVHGLTGANGVGLAVSDGTKFEAVVARRNNSTGTLEVQLVRFDTHTTGQTDVITAIPLSSILTGGNLMFAYTDNGTTTRSAFVGGHRDYAFNVNPGMSRSAHLTAAYVGPCVVSDNGTARSWIPESTF